ncbi:hypothetical protein XELAEV_18047810mg [Xenopus laevis]|uniref:Uncharacterized protein n=1 Tax=Xenopus laevis TaxID=8355 RepID=A0A974BVY3_XENLA|nr:hypothetical protein XELAEV_18047810mg [Xenopus laevis]
MNGDDKIMLKSLCFGVRNQPANGLTNTGHKEPGNKSTVQTGSWHQDWEIYCLEGKNLGTAMGCEFLRAQNLPRPTVVRFKKHLAPQGRSYRQLKEHALADPTSVLIYGHV